jgi:hypothetical protein
MAIDATILAVDRDGADVVLTLGNRRSPERGHLFNEGRAA